MACSAASKVTEVAETMLTWLRTQPTAAAGDAAAAAGLRQEDTAGMPDGALAQSAAHGIITLSSGTAEGSATSEAVARRHEIAVSAVGRSQACPFDLHALVPVPEAVLRLGPGHPASLAWLWQHWGTTQALRHVEEDAAAEDSPRQPPLDDHTVLRLTFWSADWTPWRVLAQLLEDWPALRFDIHPSYEAP